MEIQSGRKIRRAQKTSTTSELREPLNLETTGYAFLWGWIPLLPWHLVSTWVSTWCKKGTAPGRSYQILSTCRYPLQSFSGRLNPREKDLEEGEGQTRVLKIFCIQFK